MTTRPFTLYALATVFIAAGRVLDEDGNVPPTREALAMVWAGIQAVHWAWNVDEAQGVVVKVPVRVKPCVLKKSN